MTAAPLPLRPRLMRELDYGECLALLGTVTVGRFVYTNGGMPEIEPVTFVVNDHRVIFRLPPGMRSHGVVVFETGDVNRSTGVGWAVTIVDRPLQEQDIVALQTDLSRGCYLQYW